jgi:hypothetical protein
LWFAVCSLVSGVIPWLAIFIAYSGGYPDRGTTELVDTVVWLGSIVAIVSGVIALKRSKRPSHRKADHLRRSITLAAASLGELLGGLALGLLIAGRTQ